MKFSQMHERLRTVLLRRVQRGEITITRLARQTGLTKSHPSKYLHSGGQLSIKAIDYVLEAQRIGAEDLIDGETQVQSQDELYFSVPVVSSTDVLFEPEIRSGAVRMWLPMPQDLLRSLRPRRAQGRHSWRRFVAIRIDHDEAQSMDRLFYEGAIAIIDRHYNSLAAYHPPQQNLYAVRDGVRMVLRYIDAIGTHLVIRPRSIEVSANLIEIAANANPGEYIAGRVALILNEV